MKPWPGVTLEVSMLPFYQRDLQAERILTRSPDVTKDPVCLRSNSLHPRALSISLVHKIPQAHTCVCFWGWLLRPSKPGSPVKSSRENVPMAFLSQNTAAWWKPTSWFSSDCGKMLSFQPPFSRSTLILFQGQHTIWSSHISRYWRTLSKAL